MRRSGIPNLTVTIPRAVPRPAIPASPCSLLNDRPDVIMRRPGATMLWPISPPRLTSLGSLSSAVWGAIILHFATCAPPHPRRPEAAYPEPRPVLFSHRMDRLPTPDPVQ